MWRLALVGAWALLSSCTPPPQAREVPPSPLVPMANLDWSVQTGQRLIQARARRLMVPADPLTVTLYRLDNHCDRFQTETIQVPRQEGLTTTVELILAEQAIVNLKLSGYRVGVEGDAVTIDLRVSRDSPRRLQSLSLCEQRALLGSLKETLINQPDWGLTTVRFTQRGHPLIL
ncbi:MAG: hypothetical protein ACKO4L_19055 [Nodosilinea sp.]